MIGLEWTARVAVSGSWIVCSFESDTCSVPLRAVTSLGRDAGNDVVVTDEAASAKHAVVGFSDGEWWIEDAGSTNGTVVNGTKISQRERMHYGDEIQIGRIGLRLEQA